MNAVVKAKTHIDRAWQSTNTWDSEYAAARALLEDALTQQPDDTLLLTCYGAVLSDQGFHLEAARVLTEAVNLGSTDRNTFFNLGVALMNIEMRRPSASEWFGRAAASAKSDQSWAAYFDPQSH